MRKKTLFGIIGAILLASVFIFFGVGSSWFTNGDIKTWFNGWGQNKPAEDDNQTNVIITEGGSHGVSLLSTEIPTSEFSAYGLNEEEIESAVTLTISVVPENSVVTDFTWSAEFVNADSDWARGKVLDDYIKITPAEDNRSAVVACKQAFGEQIRIKVVYDGDTTIFATKVADYIKKIIGGRLTYTSFEFSNDVSGDYNIGLNVDYGVGTVQGVIDMNTFSVCTELSEESYNYLLSAESAAYPYMSKLISVNSGFELLHKAKSQNYVDDSEWFSSDTVMSFSSVPYGSLKENQYFDTAFKVMLENTTNQFRYAGTVTYKYGANYIETVELYGEWVTVSPSCITLLNSITLNGGNNGGDLLF